jgi:hypothetical protein
VLLLLLLLLAFGPATTAAAAAEFLNLNMVAQAAPATHLKLLAGGNQTQESLANCSFENVPIQKQGGGAQSEAAKHLWGRCACSNICSVVRTLPAVTEQ